MFFKKWKDLLFFLFPLIVLGVGMTFFVKSFCFLENRTLDLKVERELLLQKEDSLKILEEADLHGFFVLWNRENIQNLVLKHGVEMEFLEFENKLARGSFLGNFYVLCSLLEDFTWFFPSVVLHSFRLRPSGKNWVLDVSFKEMESDIGIIPSKLYSLDSLLFRFKPIKREEKKEKPSLVSKSKTSRAKVCGDKDFSVLGVVAGHSCLLKTQKGELWLGIGESFNGYSLDSVGMTGALMSCKGDSFWLSLKY